MVGNGDVSRPTARPGNSQEGPATEGSADQA